MLIGVLSVVFFFFFNDTATTEIYTLSLHDALPILWLFVMLHVTWSKPGLPTPPVPAKPKRHRAKAPKTFEGLTTKPHCALCERDTVHPKPPVVYPHDADKYCRRTHRLL